MTMNPYLNFAASFARLVADGKSLPLGTLPPSPRPKSNPDAPVALIFSPHPDDECLIGGLALRLMRETGLRIINVAVTQGSNPERQEARGRELKNACGWLGFELEPTAPRGLEKITPRARTNDPQRWQESVKVIADTLIRHQPRAIFFPHERDWNGTHIGTHFLVMDALRTLPADFQTRIVETEYWEPMATPNLMVELGVNDVADLLGALSFHIGEVSRNPYHLRLPAWLLDNVRRGAEVAGGQGGPAPDFTFAALYRLRGWKNGGIENVFAGGRKISAAENPAALFNPAP
jgi:LmbE family N-acetylglucosaminyl deacetylase